MLFLKTIKAMELTFRNSIALMIKILFQFSFNK